MSSRSPRALARLVDQLRACEACPWQVHTLEVGARQIGLTHARIQKVGASQVSFTEQRLEENRPLKIRTSQAGAGEIRASKITACQVCPIEHASRAFPVPGQVPRNLSGRNCRHRQQEQQHGKTHGQNPA